MMPGSQARTAQSEWIGISSALASAAAWAAGSILYKRIGERLEASSMNLVKSVLSLPLLFAALLATGVQPWGWKAFTVLILSGLLGIAAGDTLFFLSLQELGAHVLVLLSTLGQVLTVLIAVAWLGERPSWSGWIGIALIIGGVAVVLASKCSEDAPSVSVRGVVQGLLSVLCMSIAVVMAKAPLASLSAIEGTFIRMLGGVIGLTLWGAACGGLKAAAASFTDARLLRDIFAAVCVSSLGGFWLFHVALKHIDVSTANTLSSAEPLFVLPLAVVFLKEEVTRKAVLGAILSVGGIVILSARG